jgi:osmotically-inducible protein OsmY
VTLVDRVESIVFRDPRFPKGQISINAEQGEVFLRGQVARPELIQDLEEAVRKVPGVRGVENLLHLPGTPAPTSHAVRRAR